MVVIRIVVFAWIALGLRATLARRRRWPIAPFDMFAESNGPRFKEFRFSFASSGAETELFDCAELLPLEKFRVTAILSGMRTMSEEARVHRLQSIYRTWRDTRWLPVNQRAARYRYELDGRPTALRLWLVDIDLTGIGDGARSSVCSKKCLVEAELQ